MTSSNLTLLIKPDNQDVAELYVNHTKAYEGDAGLDLYFPETITIKPNSVTMINLRISCCMISSDVKYFSYLIIPRSSIAKTPLRMSNSVGLIDANYRHTLKVCVDNLDAKEYVINKGDKLFQIVAPSLSNFNVKLVEELNTTDRGEGFGSSNK